MRTFFSSVWGKLAVGAAIVLVAALLPLLNITIPGVLPGPTYTPGALSVMAYAMLIAALALSYHLIFGVAGMLSFGHAMFFAAGAYGLGILLKLLAPSGMPSEAVFLLAIVITLVIALVLAFSFGAYGAVKKKGGYPAIQALAFENTAVLPFAVAGTVVLATLTGTHGFLGNTTTSHGWAITLLLIGGGPVTALPLILFAKAANSIPLSTLGFIQYLSPTIALLTGVFLFGEPFTLAHAVCLGCIWCGLVLVTFDSLRQK